MAERTLAITLVCLYMWASAIITILIGLVILFIGSAFLLVGSSSTVGLVGTFTSIFAGIIIVYSIVEIIGAFWLWKMQKKGFIFSLIVEIIGAILGAYLMTNLLLPGILFFILPLIVALYLILKRNLFS